MLNPEEPFFHLMIPLQPTTPALVACPGCGMTYQAFRQTSTLGCPVCYDHYREALDVMVRRIHGSHRHHGKVPQAARPRHEQERARLQRLLREAVEAERYEEAALLRDRLKNMRREPGDETA